MESPQRLPAVELTLQILQTLTINENEMIGEVVRQRIGPCRMRQGPIHSDSLLPGSVSSLVNDDASN